MSDLMSVERALQTGSVCATHYVKWCSVMRLDFCKAVTLTKPIRGLEGPQDDGPACFSQQQVQRFYSWDVKAILMV